MNQGHRIFEAWLQKTAEATQNFKEENDRITRQLKEILEREKSTS